MRARAVVGEPFFEPGPPLTLGRVGAIDAGAGELVAVDVTGPGRGIVVERLGLVTDASAVVHGLAVEAGVASPWPEDVEAEAARLADDPGAADGRLDLRDVPTFTIDPADAGDHDDALSADGERVLVHIADVAAFVPEGGAVDREAARRATSVYLPGRVDPMLPAQLSSGLCSLLPGRDRFAVTVEIGPGPLRAYRSVIRSDRGLTYDEAEAMLASGEGPPELVAALGRLDRIARERAAARLERGGVAVETAERSFRLEGGAVVSGTTRRSGPAHVLVEELMLAANEAVAAELAAAGAAVPYRVHEPPEAGALERAGRAAGGAAGADAAAAAAPDPRPGGPVRGARQPVRRALRALVRARPGRVPGDGAAGAAERPCDRPANLGHSGLASPAYCHFTSPIRRLSRPAGAPRAPAPHRRALDPAAGAVGGGRSGRRTTPSPSARPRCSSGRPTTCAPRSCSSGSCTSAAGTRPTPARFVGVIDSERSSASGASSRADLPGRSWAGDSSTSIRWESPVGRRSGAACASATRSRWWSGPSTAPQGG